MNKKELKEKLIEHKIPEHEYSLNGGLPSEASCLGKNGNVWEVYYSERGLKSGLKIFESEESACDYFYTSFIKSLREMELLVDGIYCNKGKIKPDEQNRR